MCYRFIYSLSKLGDEPDTCLMAVPIRPRAHFAWNPYYLQLGGTDSSMGRKGITYRKGPPIAHWDEEPKTKLWWSDTSRWLNNNIIRIAKIAKRLPEKVQKAPNGPKMTPNDQKQVDWPIWAILDPLVPLCDLDKPTMFGYFWSKWGHFEAIPSAI